MSVGYLTVCPDSPCVMHLSQSGQNSVFIRSQYWHRFGNSVYKKKISMQLKVSTNDHLINWYQQLCIIIIYVSHYFLQPLLLDHQTHARRTAITFQTHYNPLVMAVLPARTSLYLQYHTHIQNYRNIYQRIENTEKGKWKICVL